MHIHKYNECFYLFTSVAYYTEVYLHICVCMLCGFFIVHFCHCFYASQIYYIYIGIGTCFILCIKHIVTRQYTYFYLQIRISCFTCIYIYINLGVYYRQFRVCTSIAYIQTCAIITLFYYTHIPIIYIAYYYIQSLQKAYCRFLTMTKKINVYKK